MKRFGWFTLNPDGSLKPNYIRVYPRWIHLTLYYLLYPFRWRQRREIKRIKAEMAKAAQAVIDAQIESFNAAIRFLESLPDYSPRQINHHSYAPPVKRTRRAQAMQSHRRMK